MLLRRTEIPRQTVPPVEQQMRLDPPHLFVHPQGLPLLAVEGPPAIVPEDVHGIEFFHQFRKTGKGVGDEFLIFSVSFPLTYILGIFCM